MVAVHAAPRAREQTRRHRQLPGFLIRQLFLVRLVRVQHRARIRQNSHHLRHVSSPISRHALRLSDRHERRQQPLVRRRHARRARPRRPRRLHDDLQPIQRRRARLRQRTGDAAREEHRHRRLHQVRRARCRVIALHREPVARHRPLPRLSSRVVRLRRDVRHRAITRPSPLRARAVARAPARRARRQRQRRRRRATAAHGERARVRSTRRRARARARTRGVDRTRSALAWRATRSRRARDARAIGATARMTARRGRSHCLRIRVRSVALFAHTRARRHVSNARASSRRPRGDADDARARPARRCERRAMTRARATRFDARARDARARGRARRAEGKNCGGARRDATARRRDGARDRGPRGRGREIGDGWDWRYRR